MDFLTGNWEIITMLLAGGYIAKIGVAVKNVKSTIAEVMETHAVVTAALTPDNDGVVRITKEEAEKIGKELQEDLLSLQKSGDSIMSCIPPQLRRKLPFLGKK